VRQSVELENAMLSVERLLLYSKIETEGVDTEEGDAADAAADAAARAAGVPAGWPRTGAIELRNVAMRYRRDGEAAAAAAAGGLPFALRGISLVIPAGSRLGVCGRTGAGKSSLLAALLRLSEPERTGADGGCGVLIDGVDAALVPLTRLRRAMSVVSQEPVLYQGTVRSNLDPLARSSDAACVAALAACALDRLALDAPVSESGGNLSVGERQLLCLARAVLRGTKIVLVDEATANVDPDTDALIQAALRSAFAGSTIIAVAHRLSTILDYDAVAVLGDGRVIEHGPPAGLAAREGSAFAALLHEASVKEKRHARA
jgi:ABC-type multidrug transport system fused ATPase/permease subunit